MSNIRLVVERSALHMSECNCMLKMSCRIRGIEIPESSSEGSQLANMPSDSDVGDIAWTYSVRHEKMQLQAVARARNLANIKEQLLGLSS